ncbi:hypothetical protein D3C74_255850 [compost metagenome]
MENILQIYLGLFSLVFILYPFKVLFRWLTGLSKYKNVATSFITFGALVLIYLIFITLRSETTEGILRGALLTIPIFVLYLIIDLLKSNENNKFIKFIHHLVVRILVAILTFIIVFVFYSQQLHDLFFIKSLLIGIVYVCVILRRRTKKPRKNNIHENAIQSP